MKKRMFKVLDELNLQDRNDGSSKVMVCPNCTQIKISKQGTKITMGAAGDLVGAIASGKITPLLILVDTESYNLQLAKDL
jgi:hypothetical protein